MEIASNVAYRASEGYDPALNTLDVYHDPVRPGQRPRTVVLYLHGGGWSAGDKASITGPDGASLPGWFVAHGYVFVSANFRLPGHPKSGAAGVRESADDVAKVVKWLKVNARRYGGRSSSFVLLGHSSGAHLAALVAADVRYLRSYQLQPSEIRAVIALDVPHYDVPRAIAVLEREPGLLPNQEQRLAALYKLFGSRPDRQREFSPSAFVGAQLRATSFLLVSAGRLQGHPHAFSLRMSRDFLERLQADGIAAEHVHFSQHDHDGLVRDFHGEVQACVAGFLERIQPAAANLTAATTRPR